MATEKKKKKKSRKLALLTQKDKSTVLREMWDIFAQLLPWRFWGFSLTGFLL